MVENPTLKTISAAIGASVGYFIGGVDAMMKALLLFMALDPNDTTSGSSGTTWVYNYDCGGNITSKKRYAYTTGNLGTLKQTIRLSTRAYQCLCIHNCPSLPQSVRPLLELALAHCSHSQLYSLN